MQSQSSRNDWKKQEPRRLDVSIDVTPIEDVQPGDVDGSKQ